MLVAPDGGLWNLGNIYCVYKRIKINKNVLVFFRALNRSNFQRIHFYWVIW